MKKIIYLIVLALGFSGCSVESIKSEDVNSFDAKGNINNQLAVEDPYTFYSGNSGNAKGTISVSNDCDFITVTIIPGENVDLDEAELGIFTELPALNNGNQLVESLPYNLEDVDAGFTWKIAYDSEVTSFYIFSKAWGDYAGTMVHGKTTYFIYDVEVMNCDPICSYGKGYWRNHSNDNPGNQGDAWATTEYYDGMHLGNVETAYPRDELNDILDLSNNQGNGLVILSQHLIAAKLNVAIGASMADIDATIEAADQLIDMKVPGVDSFTAEEKSDSNAIKAILEEFNEQCEE